MGRRHSGRMDARDRGYHGQPRPNRQSQADGPALMLQGDASTQAWQIVTQSFPVDPQICYRIAYEARTSDLKREQWQFDNCYVGVTMMDGDGTMLSRRVCQVASETWHDESAVFRAPEAAVTGQAVVFLSKSGTLAVRNCQVEQLEASKSFQVLVEDMDRHYSHFGIKDVNWKELVERFREKAEQASDTEEFVDVVAEMLAELKDLHVRIQSPGGQASSDVCFELQEQWRLLRVHP